MSASRLTPRPPRSSLGARGAEDRAKQPRFELRVARLDAQNEAVARGALDYRRLKDRVVEQRQTAGRQQAEKAGGDREQQHDLERRDDESRPAVIGPPADVYRIAPGLAPPLDEIAPAQPPITAAAKITSGSQTLPAGLQDLVEPFDRKRGIGLDVRDSPIRADAAPPRGSRPAYRKPRRSRRGGARVISGSPCRSSRALPTSRRSATAAAQKEQRQKQTDRPGEQSSNPRRSGWNSNHQVGM